MPMPEKMGEKFENRGHKTSKKYFVSLKILLIKKFEFASKIDKILIGNHSKLFDVMYCQILKSIRKFKKSSFATVQLAQHNKF